VSVSLENGPAVMNLALLVALLGEILTMSLSTVESSISWVDVLMLWSKEMDSPLKETMPYVEAKV